MVSIKIVPKFISPYTSLVSEGWDESLMSAIMMSDQDEDKMQTTPLEKIVMQ